MAAIVSHNFNIGLIYGKMKKILFLRNQTFD